jgi:antitoxin YefM
MNHVSYAQFHNDPAKHMDEVAKGKTPLHVTREGQPDIVMVSEDEYNGWMETVHLLSSARPPMRSAS